VVSPLVIFDFDGTLGNSLPWLRSVVNDVALVYGFKQLNDEEVELLRSMNFADILNYLAVPKWKVPAIAAHVRIKMAESIEEIPLFPGVEDAIKQLAEIDCTLAVVSSNSEPNIRSVLGAGLSNHMVGFECGVSLFGKSKKLRKVIRNVGRSGNQRTIYVGDEVRDIDAAKDAGILSTSVTWGYGKSDMLAKKSPDYLIENFDQLFQVVSGQL